ncbi:hypothetical protein C1X65_23290 [Pseudomonas sp. FW305-70]|nr:hypothetical protein C1X65_23290 [Pseudomonas sp. FW305-70]
MLAMGVNDYAGILNERVSLSFSRAGSLLQSLATFLIVRSCGAVHCAGATPGHSRTETDCAPVP